MTLNIAEARVQVTAQTKGQQEIASLEQAVNTLTRQVKTFAQQAGQSGAASAQFARRAQETAAEASKMSGTMRLASFEFMHIGTAMSGAISAGQSPMRALTMESGRLLEALQFLAIGAEKTEGVFGKFTSFLGGPWGMALMVGVNVLGSLFAAHHKAADAATEHKKAEDELSKSIDILYEKTKRATTSTRDAIYLDLQAASAARQRASDNLKAAQAELAKQRAVLGEQMSQVFHPNLGVSGELLSQHAATSSSNTRAQIDALSAQITKLQGNLDKGTAAVRGFQGQLVQLAINDRFDASAAATDRFNNRMSELNAQYRAGKISLHDFALQSNLARSALEADKKAAEHSTAAHRAGAKALREHAKAAEEFAKAMAKIADQGMGGLIRGDTALGKTFATNADTQFMSVMDQLAQNQVNRTNPMMAAGIAQFNSIGEQSFQAVSDYAGKIGSLGQGAFKLWTDALEGTQTALVNFVATGKLSVKSLADSIIADLARMAIEQAVMLPLTGALEHILGGGSVALSGSWSNFIPHATGGIVSAPTLFPMGGGKVGSMAESGPEAIMPLKRLPSGRLGVETSGGGAGNIVVNVDATGTQVQGNKQQASQLGTAIGAAVRAELIRQKRPGGILAN